MSYRYNYNANKPFQCLKAAFGCYGIHIALTILLSLLLVAFDVTSSFHALIVSYMLFGWIPLAIWIYPFLKKKMK